MIVNLNINHLILLKDANTKSQSFYSTCDAVEKTTSDFEDDLEFLSALALQNEKVVAVKSFETEDVRVFGVLTLPIYLKSERDNLKSSLAHDLSTSKTTYISFDNDVYRAIKDNMTDEQKQKVVATILARENKQ